MKSRLILFSLLICILIPKVSASRSENSLTWHIVSSPVKSRLGFITMLSSSKGYISGKNLLELKQGKWQLFSKQPPVSGMDCFFVLDENNIWISKPTVNNSSDLYHFNGKIWQKIESPLANQISNICFNKDGSAYISGDREIVRRNNGKWEFIEYPDNGAVLSLDAWKDIIWLHSNTPGIMSYSYGKWTRHLADHYVKFLKFNSPAHGFALSGIELWEYKDNQWALHSKAPLLTDVVKLSFLENGEIWGCGYNGLIVHFDKKKWMQAGSPVTEDLDNIQMLSEHEGWITGSNGIILHYGQDSLKEEIKSRLGFQAMKIVASGANLDDEYGTAIEDFNNDGLQDVYSVCIFSPNRIYINNSTIHTNKSHRNILFKEEAVYRNISGIVGDTSYTLSTEIYLSAGIADIDNDNDKDFYLCNLAGKNKLFLNNGKGYFRNVSAPGRAVDRSERTNSAVFGDVDNDGDADLFIVNEYSTNRLYLNNGNGYFNEVTLEAGLLSSGGGMSASFADLDQDNDVDLYVTNWSKKNIMYRNDTHGGKVRFSDVTKLSGTGGDAFAESNGLAFADIDNDGDPDLFVANRKLSNCLYLNEGKFRFRDVTDAYIGTDTMFSYGAVFSDFNLDGYTDLYITNIGENVLYKNIEGSKFLPITMRADAVLNGYGTGSAAGDIDNDGDTDLYAANYTGGSSMLFVNNINTDNYISVRLQGTKSCRDAIGAKVWLYQDTVLRGYREIICGSGYASQNSLTVNFGTTKDVNYTLIVYFPASGIKKIIKDIKSPQQLIIAEEEGIAAQYTLLQKSLLRFMSDPGVHSVILKSIFAFLLIGISFIYGRRKYRWNLKTASVYYTLILILFYAHIYIFYYENYFFITILPFASLLVSLMTIHLIYERVILVKKNRIERQAARDSIARDLHDDLASTLSSSVIYTEALRRSFPENGDKMLLNKINSLLTEASETITDIVWTVSPQHDSLDDLLMRLRVLITDRCRTKYIELEIEDNIDDREIIIQDDIRRNIFLIFKEALTNIIKHSEADHVRFNFNYNKPVLEIILEDNGIGFVYNPKGNKNSLHGHGLRNILKRAKEINCELAIKSVPENGTKILLRKKMT